MVLGPPPGQKQHHNQSGFSVPAMIFNRANINIPATAMASESPVASMPKSQVHG